MMQITTFMSKDSEYETINAEVMFTQFVIAYNLPLAVASHAGHVFREMFPDSDVAKKYGCARTKTTAIVQMLCCEDDKMISSILTNSVYSLATDGSTDMDDSNRIQWLYDICTGSVYHHYAQSFEIVGISVDVVIILTSLHLWMNGSADESKLVVCDTKEKMLPSCLKEVYMTICAA
ncbi:uncharacterized protein LOC143229845 isoform X1 [Tachypleus tridentatus]|uniref:uncharacterized protein LOC143229845 isoform X1 n=1 Tax=Tachypleus tridentatus TaxID=6853 RepID=UPI003FCF0ADC